jgi:hypothetical protein
MLLRYTSGWVRLILDGPGPDPRILRYQGIRVLNASMTAKIPSCAHPKFGFGNFEFVLGPPILHENPRTVRCSFPCPRELVGCSAPNVHISLSKLIVALRVYTHTICTHKEIARLMDVHALSYHET